MRKFKSVVAKTVWTEVFRDEQGSLLDSGMKRVWWDNEGIEMYLKEVKEPQTITIWKNVWRRKDGSLLFGCDYYEKEHAIRDAFEFRQDVNTFVDTVSFTYTEKEEV